MDIKRGPFSLFLFMIFSFFGDIEYCLAIETISPSQVISDSESITSLNQTFRLGFFSPGNSSNRYVGIWYNNIPGEIVYVWVANRENPIKDSSGVLRIDEDGNMVVLDGKRNVVWTTNFSIATNSTQAELLDSGNLVLRGISSDGNNVSNTRRILWQSFEHPTDTILNDTNIGVNLETGEKQAITSWKTDSDPSKGRYSLELEPLNIPQLVLWNGSQRHWRTGPWDGIIFIGVEGMYSVYLNGINLVRDDQERDIYVHFSYNQSPRSLRYVLSPMGLIRGMVYEINGWSQRWAGPMAECDYYGKCGSFGFCNMLSVPVCSCLKGYVPKSTEEWNNGNWSSGCIRRTLLLCERNNTIEGEGKGDAFFKYERMKVPDFVNWIPAGNLEQCKQTCLMNCSCTAYSFVGGIGCMSWFGNLLDTNMFSTGSVDLYIRVASSELDKKKNNTKVVVMIVTFIVGLIFLGLGIYIFWRRMNKQKGKRNTEVFSDAEKVEETELPSFKYEKLAAATDNFSLANKLGEGGFGSVYKGKLPGGEEIAVKRLSKSSGQGTEEFKNEVVVISKLQHRNLVRLLGFSIERDEKMLIYEYMPNKSLDAFLFDPARKTVLDWRKCFQIIEGIGRGILYLHRDSRLRVIHRDLKPSNVLLDRDLNPKIADFGMARIVGGNELEANTRRVVGTYGYMSPEYAMEGQFSEKSDVYSFGVLLLEIVSGMRNTSFYHHEESLSLIGHVWKLWNEDRIQELIDNTFSETSYKEILRCICVGLLCVQDLAKDRPSMSSVVMMLTSEITGLPTPKQPAFSGRQVIPDSDSSCGINNNCSTNNVSITILQGR
ncbi:non-specific serine/threonine protein kinase [Ranunculus cassubicifolius]